MKLCIKQKVFSLGDKFNIYDEYGNIKYLAKGKLFSLYRNLTVTDMNGEDVIHIKGKFSFMKPKFDITVPGFGTCEMIKEIKFFKQEYSIPQLNMRICGDFLAHNYVIFQNGIEIASLEKEYFTWGDTYCINIPDTTNELIALAAILVIDCCMANQNNHD